MKEAKFEELRAEYNREDFGSGVRGKFFESYQKRTNGRNTIMNLTEKNFFTEDDITDFVTKILQEGKRKFAVLCGAGISADSGILPAEPFMRKILMSGLRCKDVSYLFGEGNRSLRYEGLLEVLQRTVDEELEVIDKCYFSELKDKHGKRDGKPNPNHKALAKIAASNTVVTTNPDILIEEVSKEENRANLVHVKQEEWEKAQQCRVPSKGLWKIHGTIRVWDPIPREWVKSRDCGPIVTLKLISRSRHDKARKKVFEKILKKYDLVVVGYSGLDDFDVSQWLRETESSKRIFWIDFFAKTFSSLERYTKETLEILARKRGYENVFVFGARHKRDNVRNCLWQIANMGGSLSRFGSKSNSWKKVISAWAKEKFCDKWQRQFFQGELFKHYGDFTKAVNCLDKAYKLASSDKDRLAKTLVVFSEAQTAIGNSRDAVAMAKEAMMLEPMGNWRSAGELAYAAALLALPTPPYERLEKLLKTIRDNERADPFAGARAKVELSSIYRDLKQTPNQKTDSETEGDIYAEAKRTHWEARQDWAVAINSRDLEEAIKKMDAAVNLRERLGDYPGLCDSLNVLGIMKQRLSEWYQWDGKPHKSYKEMMELAKECHKQASDTANDCGLTRKEAAPLLAIALLHLRLGELEKAKKKLYTEAKERASWYQRYDQWIMKFLMVMLEITELSKSNINEATKYGYCRFKELWEEFSDAEGAIEKRIRDAAHFNLALCNDRLVGREELSLLQNIIQQKPFFWRHKLEKSRLDKNLVQAMFDPLAP